MLVCHNVSIIYSLCTKKKVVVAFKKMSLKECRQMLSCRSYTYPFHGSATCSTAHLWRHCLIKRVIMVKVGLCRSLLLFLGILPESQNDPLLGTEGVSFYYMLGIFSDQITDGTARHRQPADTQSSVSAATAMKSCEVFLGPPLPKVSSFIQDTSRNTESNIRLVALSSKPRCRNNHGATGSLRSGTMDCSPSGSSNAAHSALVTTQQSSRCCTVSEF